MAKKPTTPKKPRASGAERLADEMPRLAAHAEPLLRPVQACHGVTTVDGRVMGPKQYSALVSAAVETLYHSDTTPDDLKTAAHDFLLRELTGRIKIDDGGVVPPPDPLAGYTPEERAAIDHEADATALVEGGQA